MHPIIDSYHDRRTAFRFSTTPRGVQKDVYKYNDGNEDTNWVRALLERALAGQAT